MATSEIYFTWTSAFAQGESESLSNNVKWGKRKGFAQGKYPFPYQSMLGYRKGPDGQPEIVPEEAEQIQLIFRLFLLGPQPAANQRGPGAPEHSHP